MARFKQLSRGRTVPFTQAEEAKRDAEELEATRPRTPVEKDARSASEAAQRMTDPLVVVLAKAAGVPLPQFEADLAAEIRLRL